MTFLLGYLAFVYVAAQFANAARARIEDKPGLAYAAERRRAYRDFCSAYGLLLGISGALLALLVAMCPCLGEGVRLAWIDGDDGRAMPLGWWLVYVATLILTIAFVAWHYVVEWTEIVPSRPPSELPGETLAALLGLGSKRCP